MSKPPHLFSSSLPLIVLVEDNQNDELLARHAITATQFQVDLRVARDGEEALSLLLPSAGLSGGRSPAMILLDLNLPKLNGHEVLRQLQADARTRLVPVIVLTSSRDESDLTRAYQLGARSYICKPIELAQFVVTMRQVLSYWLTVNVPAPTVR